MEQEIDTPTRIGHLGECLSLIEGLCEPGGASLLFSAQPSQPHPVLLMAVEYGERLVIYITAVPELACRIERNDPFHLCSQVDGAMLRTSSQTVLERLDVPGRVQFSCAYPQWLELMHRRGSFRTELRSGMCVQVELHPQGAEQPLLGQRVNLPLCGCLVELPANQAVRIDGPQLLELLVLNFPGGQRLAMGARVCYIRNELDWQALRFGCQFLGVSADQERRLWLYVREIEREKARTSCDSTHALQPSALFFQRTAPAQTPPLPRSSIGRRLGRVAAYLDTQLIRLRLGGVIDSKQLSQHGIALDVRLADLAQGRGLPRQAVKTIVASALVHDLGKTLFPTELHRVRRLDSGQRQAFGAHVGLLRQCLEGCKWLAAPLMDAVIGTINERLDGTGYPRAARRPPGAVDRCHLPALARQWRTVRCAVEPALHPPLRPDPDRQPGTLRQRTAGLSAPPRPRWTHRCRAADQQRGVQSAGRWSTSQRRRAGQPGAHRIRRGPGSRVA